MNMPPGAGESTILGALRWVEAVVTGPLATGIAVLAVAGVGLFMLTGRIDYRRGIQTIVGCFVLFGAASISNGIIGYSSLENGTSVPIQMQMQMAPALPAPKKSDPYDPYAGASLIRQ